MSLAVQQDVLGLQVAVHDFFGVEVLDGTDDLRGVEEACAIAEASPAAQVAKELASRHIVHQHVEEALVVVCPESGQREVKSEAANHSASSVVVKPWPAGQNWPAVLLHLA